MLHWNYETQVKADISGKLRTVGFRQKYSFKTMATVVSITCEIKKQTKKKTIQYNTQKQTLRGGGGVVVPLQLWSMTFSLLKCFKQTYFKLTSFLLLLLTDQ